MRKALNGPATLRRACDAVDQAAADMDRRAAVGPSRWWSRALTRAADRWERKGWEARAVFDLGPTFDRPPPAREGLGSRWEVADEWGSVLRRERKSQERGRTLRAQCGYPLRAVWPVGVGGA